MDSRAKFEEWWKNADRQTIDDLYSPSEIAEAAWLAGCESMRDEAARIVSNDAYAITFQTQGKYRGAVVEAIRKIDL